MKTKSGEIINWVGAGEYQLVNGYWNKVGEIDWSKLDEIAKELVNEVGNDGKATLTSEFDLIALSNNR